MAPQAAHALPQPPSGGIAAMHILRAGLQPPPPKKPAVPDWVRQELLKRGLQSDGSGGTTLCLFSTKLKLSSCLY